MSSVNLPEDWARFSLPPALDARLTALLDKQDESGELAERLEADALCELVDMLTLLKLRADRASRK